jgi:dUTPase
MSKFLFSQDQPQDQFLSNHSHIIERYTQLMYLKIYVDNPDPELKQIYLNAALAHNQKLHYSEHIDAGFDLFSPYEESDFDSSDDSCIRKLDFGIKCSARMIRANNQWSNTGYYMYPRSSLSKTKFRLANCVGIIDSGYRGNLIGMFDILSSKHESFNLSKHQRLLQICAPSLSPIYVEIVDTFEELGEKTERGSGGFGSTGI